MMRVRLFAPDEDPGKAPEEKPEPKAGDEASAKEDEDLALELVDDDDDEPRGVDAEAALAEINETLRDLVSPVTARRLDQGGDVAETELDRIIADEEQPEGVRRVASQLKDMQERAAEREAASLSRMEKQYEQEFRDDRRKTARSYGLTKEERAKVDRYFGRLLDDDPNAAAVLSYEEAGVRVLGRSRFSGSKARAAASGADASPGGGKPNARNITPSASPSSPKEGIDKEVAEGMTMNQVGQIFGKHYSSSR